MNEQRFESAPAPQPEAVEIADFKDANDEIGKEATRRAIALTEFNNSALLNENLTQDKLEEAQNVLEHNLAASAPELPEAHVVVSQVETPSVQVEVHGGDDLVSKFEQADDAALVEPETAAAATAALDQDRMNELHGIHEAAASQNWDQARVDAAEKAIEDRYAASK